MAETFAERKKKQKKEKTSFLPKISLPHKIHLPLASIANAAKHMKMPSEHTYIGKGAIHAADLNMRAIRNFTDLKADPQEISKRFHAMLGRCCIQKVD